MKSTFMFCRNTAVEHDPFFTTPLRYNDVNEFHQHVLELPYISSVQWFTLTTFIFSAGLIGIVFNNNNFLLLLLKIELMFLGISLYFIGSSVYFLHPDGFIFALLLLGLTAAESALGLSLFLSFYMKYKTIKIDKLFEEQDEGNL